MPRCYVCMSSRPSQQSLITMGDKPRISAIVGGALRHLCRCRTHRCCDAREPDPRTDNLIGGHWVGATTWNAHMRADKRLDSLRTRLSLTSNMESDVFGFTQSASAIANSQRDDYPDSPQLRDVEERVPTARTPATSTPSNSAGANAEEYGGSVAPCVPPLPSTQDEVASGGRPDYAFNVDRFLAELESVLSIVNQAILAFSFSAPLLFTSPPTSESPPYTFPNHFVREPNSGSLQLESSASINQSILAHERSMLSFLRLVEAAMFTEVPAIAHVQSKIRDVVVNEISRINDIKGREWDAQRLQAPTCVDGNGQVVYKGHPRILVNCGKATHIRSVPLRANKVL